MDLSIIIVSWNTRELLRQCLDSVYQFPPDCPFEVCVVDNASEDGSSNTVRERFPQVRLIQNHDNIGFARANNQAIGVCQGEIRSAVEQRHCRSAGSPAQNGWIHE